MSDEQATERMNHVRPLGQRRVQAVVVEHFRVIAQPGTAFDTLKRQLLRQGFPVQETAHFLFAQVPTDHSILLVHRFSSQQIDNNLEDALMQELAPHGLMTSEQTFAAAFIGVVTSLNPTDPVAAWGDFSLNTLQRLRARLDEQTLSTHQQDTITSFAAIYRRLLALLVGSSLLDVGCACAFWPVLVAERSDLKPAQIVGVDTRADALQLSSHLAALAHVKTLTFLQADILTPEFLQVGVFDTVTAIHLLEHLSEAQMPHALRQLLSVTAQRLLIAVPYEEQPTAAYGHAQVFTPESLAAWGQWCLAHLHGKATMQCEQVQGGLLVIDRTR